MTRRWMIVTALATACIGMVLGYFLHATTMGRIQSTAAVCIAMQEAVRGQMLQPAQVRELGHATGVVLRRDYTGVASALAIPQAHISMASAQSACSQFLAGLSEVPATP